MDEYPSEAKWIFLWIFIAMSGFIWYVEQENTEPSGAVVFLVVIAIILLPSLLNILSEMDSGRTGRSIDGEETKKLVSRIQSYDPPEAFDFETNYQSGLYSWLKEEFPQIRWEEQRGSSRPDLVLDEHPIEIKGPTTHEDLQTLADKTLRYRHKFSGTLVIVLFNIQCTDRLLKEWKEGFDKERDDVVIITR